MSRVSVTFRNEDDDETKKRAIYDRRLLDDSNTDAVSLLAGQRICDSQIAGSSPG